jgi:hypothetical protein
MFAQDKDRAYICTRQKRNSNVDFLSQKQRKRVLKNIE